MTLRELSEYLNVKEERIIVLVEKKVIFAYKIGGELLRCRKEQIDAIRSEIESRILEDDRVEGGTSHYVRKKPGVYSKKGEEDNFQEKWSDFLYFNDFYIVSGVLIAILLIIIFRG